MSVAALLLSSANAYVLPVPAAYHAHCGTTICSNRIVSPIFRRTPPPPVALFDTGLESLGAGEVGVVAFAGLLLAAVAGGINPTATVPLLLILLSGDPDEREAAGKNDNAAVKAVIESFTPSAWKKAYLGGNAVEGEEAPLLDLPAWQGEEARALVEPEAVATVKAMQLEPINVPSVGAVDTCFISIAPQVPVKAPPLLLIHGFDSSVLELRYIAPQLADAGLRVEAMEWWTGGFTDRKPFLEHLERETGSTPWELIREHTLAFWERQLAGEKAIVVGFSLGGAVAQDFAVAHPECVEALVLVDAGGESYAQPDPFLTSLAADPVVNLFQWRANNGMLPYPHVWAKEDSWRQALRAYLKSGGYQVRVNPELIKTVPQRALVLWGEEDDVLPVEDAYKYQKDLPNCVGVELVPNAQHAPALENPDYVSKSIIDFALKVAAEREVAPL